ncbi:MAG TPA: DUF805 domain-containing protein [Burkholderiaceae bacterium]|jgi:uncharacterized membrane protein YhaH (DUF805 family)|nr:DUF805 domain-containing protein [Burkholderiaceae bacterium]
MHDLDDADSPRRILFSFAGRIGRRAWWLWGVAAMLGLGLYATVLLRVAGVAAATTDTLVNLLLLWPALAISAKRWHDRGKSGWWVLVVLVPVVGWIWAVVENGFLRGTPGPNPYGENPLRNAAP